MSNSKRCDEVRVALDGGAGTTALHYGAAADASVGATLVFAHGAGAGHRHPFITSFAQAMADRGFDVVTFNFPYMEQGRKLPDKSPVLEGCYAKVIATVHARIESARRFVFIGGKSMGGRMATQLAAADAALPMAGLLMLGYPLHPPGKPQQRRDAHLPHVGRPMLIVQGSRDAFGTPDELIPVLAPIVPAATLHVIDGGDHSFKIPRTPGRTQAVVDDEIRETCSQWMRSIISASPARV